RARTPPARDCDRVHRPGDVLPRSSSRRRDPHAPARRERGARLRILRDDRSVRRRRPAAVARRHGHGSHAMRPISAHAFSIALIAATVALFVAGAATISCSPRGGAPSAEAEAPIWYCPMHPTVTSDKTGDCPICHMRLVKLERARPSKPDGGSGATAASSSPATAPKKALWRSTMNPGEISDHPGKDSMGMDMVPVEPSAAAGSAGAPTGWSDIDVPLDRLQQGGVTFGTVATKRMARTLRASGRVAYDETRLHHGHTKLAGWIEHLHVDAVGQAVRRGDALFDLYSPEL